MTAHRSVTKGDFVAREFSVREPVRPPTTTTSFGASEGAEPVASPYLTTHYSHFEAKSSAESNAMTAAGSANTVLCTYNIINGDASAKTAALPCEGYSHGRSYSKKVPRPPKV